MQGVGPISQPKESTYSKVIHDRFFRITLLALGILTVSLGSVYLAGLEKTMTVTAGAILIAFAIIFSCYCRNEFPLATETNNLASDQKEKRVIPGQDQKKSPPAPYGCMIPPGSKKIFTEEELRQSRLGRALLDGIKADKLGVQNYSYTSNLNGTFEKQGFSIYFKDKHNAQIPPFHVLLRPQEEANKTQFWRIDPIAKRTNTKELERLEKALKEASCKVAIDWASIIEGTHPIFELADDSHLDHDVIPLVIY